MTDLVLVNANVLTMDPDPSARPRASAVAIAGGRIAILDEVPADAANVVDLRGATVLPGFHDAHYHMPGFGMSLGEVDLRADAAGTLDELYAAVARRVHRVRKEEVAELHGVPFASRGARPALPRARARFRSLTRHCNHRIGRRER